MGKKKKKISDRQMELNRHYASEIAKVLSKPMPYETEKTQSDISYAEAKSILKHTIRQIEKVAIRF